MHDSTNPRMHIHKPWLVWLCVAILTTAGIAESAHFHADLSSADQHCSICVVAHSVATPARVAIPITTPQRCLAILVVGGPAIPDSRPLLSASIRPPPVA